MKKAMVLVLALVLVASFAVGVMAKGGGDPHPPTHDCYTKAECNEFGCILWKCCVDCVWDKGGYDCTDEICVPLT